MKKTVLSVIVVVIVVAAGLFAHFSLRDRGRLTTEPGFTDLARVVSANELVSDRDPAVVMRFESSFVYLGGQKFVLYGVADTEQHFFAEITPDDRLQSLYWIQFEGYLPDKPYQYDYEDSPLRMQLGDFPFYVDTAPVQSDPNRKRRKGTDGSLARQFVLSKGYTFPQNYFYARLVHLTDESRRKELMVIFMDDLTSQGLTGSQLEEEGSAADRWPDIEAGHLAKIERTLSLSRNRNNEMSE